MSEPGLFRDLTEVYEAMVNWPQRLAREEPFYRRVFAAHQVRRVVDVACGVGHHAALFQRWGLSVEGADVSPAMIERARRQHGESPDLRWAVRSFDQPISADETFDAAICAGNSLALAADRPMVGQTLQQMFAAVRPGGIVVVQVLNLWRFPDGPCVWQKCQRTVLPQGEVVIVKGVHRSGQQGFLDLIVISLGPGSERHTESTPLLGLEAGELEARARAAGAFRCEFFGGYQGETYVRESSVDLILVARR
ncbi:MAG: class I SAM-dependent methyltransferase [Candidatus Anammoximicrobium sp.]|nr:class I SAM-dependent methyltransferase [Candidatus Anammoximicrobium sp.]